MSEPSRVSAVMVQARVLRHPPDDPVGAPPDQRLVGAVAGGGEGQAFAQPERELAGAGHDGAGIRVRIGRASAGQAVQAPERTAPKPTPFSSADIGRPKPVAAPISTATQAPTRRRTSRGRRADGSEKQRESPPETLLMARPSRLR